MQQLRKNASLHDDAWHTDTKPAVEGGSGREKIDALAILVVANSLRRPMNQVNSVLHFHHICKNCLWKLQSNLNSMYDERTN